MKDLFPKTHTYGPAFYGITSFNDKVIFTSDDSIHGSEPWISDGTEAGTHLLKDCALGTTRSYPEQFTVVDNKVYFVTSPVFGGTQELWVSDGTEEGTVKLADQTSLNQPYVIAFGNLTAFKNRIYFTTSVNGYINQERIWKSDGTPAGTILIKDSSSVGGISNMVPFGDYLYFRASDNLFQPSSLQLWRTNGTPGSAELANVNASPSLGFGSLVPFKNNIYFSATAESGSELYKYDTSTRMIDLVKDINSGTSGSSPVSLTASKDFLYFAVSTDSLTSALWKTDGTSNGTSKLKDFDTIPYNSIHFKSDTFNNKLIYSVIDATHGQEIWISDGTVQGTKLVKDINPGVASSISNSFNFSDQGDQSFTSFKNICLFAANDGVHGYELWKTDGLSSNTQQVKDINTSTTAASFPYIDYTNKASIITTDDKLIFQAHTEDSGQEPWITDGTSAGTLQLKDIAPGYYSGLTYAYFTKFNGKYYFEAQTPYSRTSIYSTDGTSAGTTLFQDLGGAISQYNGQDDNGAGGNITATDNHIFVFKEQQSNGGFPVDLYASDGVNPFTAIKKNITHTGFYNYPYAVSNFYPVSIGNTLFFSAGNSSYNSDELWKSDGTEAGTVQVKDIRSGSAGSLPDNLTVYKGQVYFRASLDGGASYYLYHSDGTDVGTTSIKQQQILVGRQHFLVSGNYLFFVASDNIHGPELWKTDGTEEGTVMVKDINTDGFNYGSFIDKLTDVNGTVYFLANDGIHGSELWKSDGTEQGTMLVKDITEGSQGTYISEMVNVNGTLFLTVYQQLWRSDGTAQNTVPMVDAGLADLYYISQLTPVGNLLYLQGTSSTYGAELYVGNTANVLPVTLLQFSGKLQNEDAVLQWTTTNETNAKAFNLQRSSNGVDFITIATLAAKGSSSTINNYSYTDKNVVALDKDKVYYRLQQTDNTGSNQLSRIVMLPIPAAITISVTPNPAKNTAFFHSEETLADAQISITDMAGHAVITDKLSITAGAQVPVDVSHLAPGVYSLTVNYKSGKKSFKIVIEK